MKKPSLISLVLMLPLIAWVGCEVYHAKTSSAAGLAGYSEYRAKLPEPRSARMLKKGESDYVAYYGPVTTLAMVSGPPVYVFDLSGKLVDWSRDMGDDPRFAEEWKTHDGNSISISEADALLGN